MALKTISINTGTKLAAEIDSYAALGAGYQTKIVNPADPATLIDNPETPAQFMRKKILINYQSFYEAGLIKASVDTARSTALINKGTLT